MDVYIYMADLWCKDCGERIRASITAKGKAPVNPNDEYSYDSDDFPKGPYPSGGGESDSPQHCGEGGECINAIDTETTGWGKVGVLLENSLTDAGIEYVKDAVTNEPSNPVVQLWFDYYSDYDIAPETEPDECEECHDNADSMEYAIRDNAWYCNMCGHANMPKPKEGE